MPSLETSSVRCFTAGMCLACVNHTPDSSPPIRNTITKLIEPLSLITWAGPKKNLWGSIVHLLISILQRFKYYHNQFCGFLWQNDLLRANVARGFGRKRVAFAKFAADVFQHHCSPDICIPYENCQGHWHAAQIDAK